MALVFTESWDSGLTIAQLGSTGKWTTVGAGGAIVQSTSGRNGGGCLGGQAANQPNSAYRRLQSSEEGDLLIIGCAMQQVASVTTSPFIQLSSDNGATNHLAISIAGGSLVASRGTAAGIVLGTATEVVPVVGVWYYVEAKVRLHDTTGSVDVKVDGATVLSLTNVNTKNAGTKTVFDGFSVHTAITYSGGSTFDHRIDDVYVCNEQGATCNDFLGDVRIECITPNAEGNYSEWTPKPINRFLDANVSGIETDATGWSALAGTCTITRVTSPVNALTDSAGVISTSTGALQITAITSNPTNATIRSPIGTAGVPVLAGVNYHFGLYSRSGQAFTRNIAVAVEWYDASGTLIGTRTAFSYLGDNAVATYKAMNGNGVFLSPAQAAYAAMVVEFWCNAGDVMYMDDAWVYEGAVNGLSTTVPGGSTSHFTTVQDMVASAAMGDMSHVVGQTDDLTDTWQHTSLASATTQPVKGVMVWAHARTDTASAKSLTLIARSAGVDAQAADIAVPQTYGLIGAAHETAPGGANWTVTTVNAAEFGVKVRP